MKAYAKSSDFWPSASELLGEGDELARLSEVSFSQAFAEVFRRYAQALRSRPLTLEILSWETVDRNTLTVAMEEVREAVGLALVAFLSQMNPPKGDWLTIGNIFSTAIHYLAIRGRKIKTYTGVDIVGDSGWDRLIDGIEFLVSDIDSTDVSINTNSKLNKES